MLRSWNVGEEEAPNIDVARLHVYGTAVPGLVELLAGATVELALPAHHPWETELMRKFAGAEPSSPALERKRRNSEKEKRCRR